MPVVINYKNSAVKKNLSNFVLFVDDKFNVLTLKNHISASEYAYISDLVKTKNLKKNLLVFDINSKRKIILVSLKQNITNNNYLNATQKQALLPLVDTIAVFVTNM